MHGQPTRLHARTWYEKKKYKILHDEETRLEESFGRVDHATCSGQNADTNADARSVCGN